MGGNVIAFNTLGGVLVGTSTSTRNRIRGNAIFGNPALGSELAANALAPDGVTLNDAGDVDTGPNGRQNFPVLAIAESSGDRLALRGALNSNPDTATDLDFYASATCDPSGHGEGERYLGSASVTTDANGDAAFDVTLNPPAVPGHVITATATSTELGNTSEFSACLAVTPGRPSLAGALEPATGDFILNWETSDAAWTAEEIPKLEDLTGWKPAAGILSVTGAQHTVRIASPTGARFFRLRKP